jgi:protein O-GlcNAc transferase
MKSSFLNKNLKLARQYLKVGDIYSAEKIFQSIIEKYPGNLESKQFFASVAQRNNFNLYRNNLSHELYRLKVLIEAQQFLQARSNAQLLTKSHPDSFELWAILGDINNYLNNKKEAAEAYQKAIVCNPLYPNSYNNLGIILHEGNRIEDAILHFRKAVSLNANFYQAYFNLANALKDLKNFDLAIKTYQRALELEPRYAEAYNNLGVIFHAQEEHEKALECFLKAIYLEEEYAEAYCNIGLTYVALNDTESAIANFKQSLSIDPLNPLTHFNIAIAYENRKDYIAANQSFEKYLILEKKNNVTSSTATAHLLFNYYKLCEWRNENVTKYLNIILSEDTKAIPPFIGLALEDEPKRQQQRSIEWMREADEHSYPEDNKRFDKAPDAPIRIGLFTADLREHPIMYCLAGYFKARDKSAFEVMVFNLNIERTNKWIDYVFGTSCEIIHIGSQIDSTSIEIARSKKLDIAIDLSGYTEGARTNLFIKKLAPIQINFLGFPGTMGLDAYDYIIADQFVIPAEHRDCYTENVIYLPHTYFPIDNSLCRSETETSKADHFLPDDKIILCCFNNSYKITSNEFDVWMRVLRCNDKCILWLLSNNEEMEKNIKKEVALQHIDPERIIFAPFINKKSQHLERLRHADLFVDTFNYNAHTSACDALWADVPVVTMQGRQFSARVASSILNAVNLPELVTHTMDEYENLILELTSNPLNILSLKEKLRLNKHTSPLFDVNRFTKNFEAGLRRAYRNYSNNIEGDIWVEESYRIV